MPYKRIRNHGKTYQYAPVNTILKKKWKEKAKLGNNLKNGFATVADSLEEQSKADKNMKAKCL